MPRDVQMTIITHLFFSTCAFLNFFNKFLKQIVTITYVLKNHASVAKLGDDFMYSRSWDSLISMIIRFWIARAVSGFKHGKTLASQFDIHMCILDISSQRTLISHI